MRHFRGLVATVLPILLLGCAQGDGAAYLSLADRALVVGSARDGWSGPHRVLGGNGPQGRWEVVREGLGPVPHSIVRAEDGEVWIVVGEQEHEWLRVEKEGSNKLRDIVRRRGEVEVFVPRLREFMGLGGLGI